MPRARFKVQDLLVDVVAPNLERLGKFCVFPTKACPQLTLVCPNNTHIACWLGVTPDPCGRGVTVDCLLTITDGCGANYSTCFQTDLFIIDVRKLIINPKEIDVLREQVNVLLEAAGARGQELAREMQPQNLAQAELLEENLAAALEEVQALKERLG
jgi:hypothetical protein